MGREHQFLAMDLGAESGRGEVVTLRDGKVTLEEAHRFANRPVRLGGTLYWDFPYLFAEVCEAMRACAGRGVVLTSVGVDTWGVDFGLLAGDGVLLGNPVHYRDGRTDGIHKYSDPIMTRREIYAATGYEPWQISSLFQLLSMQRDGSDLLKAADTFLNMPDLFNYFLAGEQASELSIANTSNLLGVDCQWSAGIIERFGLPKVFGNLVAPATVLGPLAGAVADATGLDDVPVVAVCGHDTSSAVAAVPGEGDNWAFLSCGTWSILGSLVDRPVATPRAMELGFTNEYMIGGWYLARNILGLWLVQELRRKWNSSGDPWDYDRLTAAAGQADPRRWSGLIDAADDSLLAPADMEEALGALLRRSGQGPPPGRGYLVRCVLESLALETRRRLASMSELTARSGETLYMVGGGTANKLLCQFTADACGIPVYAGLDQCTAMGNALGQALAMGILKTPQEIRQVMRDSFELTTYQPQDQGRWSDLRERYERLTSGA